MSDIKKDKEVDVSQNNSMNETFANTPHKSNLDKSLGSTSSPWKSYYSPYVSPIKHTYSYYPYDYYRYRSDIDVRN